MGSSGSILSGMFQRVGALSSATLNFMGVVLVCVVGYFGYVQARERENETRLQDLLVFQDALESAARNAWVKVQRPCAQKSVGDNVWCGSLEESTWVLRRPQQRDDPRTVGSSIVLCLEPSPRGNTAAPCSEEIEVQGWLEELELHSQFLEVMIVDGTGTVIAEWKRGPGRISAIALPKDVALGANASDAVSSKVEDLWRLPGSAASKMTILPRVESVVLGERDFDLFLAQLELPRGRASGIAGGGVAASGRARAHRSDLSLADVEESNAASANAAATSTARATADRQTFLCAVANRSGLSVPRRIAAGAWSWAFLAGIVFLLSIAGLPFVRRTRTPARNHLLVAALCVGLAAVLGLALLRSLVEVKEVRGAIRSTLQGDAEIAKRELESAIAAAAARLRTLSPLLHGICSVSPPACLGSALDDLMSRRDEVWFIADATGDQLWLNSKDALVNRGGREYFKRIVEDKSPGEVLGPFPTVPANKGDVRWILGVRATPEVVAPPGGQRGSRAIPKAGIAEVGIVALRPPLGERLWDLNRIVVDHRGRILFSQPELYQLTDTRVDELLRPAGAIIESLRLGVDFEIQELSFRREPAMAVGRRLHLDGVMGATDGPYFLIEVATLGATNEAVLQALASTVRMSKWVWVTPLLLVILVTVLAPQRVLSSLYPQRPPVGRYLAGALGALALIFALEWLVVPELAPWARPRLAVLMAGLAPAFAYSFLASDEASASRALRFLLGPKYLFRWYPTAYVLVIHAAGLYLASRSGAMPRSAIRILVSALFSLLIPLLFARSFGYGARSWTDSTRPGWRRARHLHWPAYVIAVACALMLMFGYPCLLTMNALFSVTREALARTGPTVPKVAVSREVDHRPAPDHTAREDWSRSRRLLVRDFGGSGERRFAALASSAPVPGSRLVLPPISQARDTGLILLTLAAMVAAWGVFCAGAFAWVVLTAPRKSRARAPARSDWLRPAEVQVLADVHRGGLLRWADADLASSLIGRGWISNRDGLRVSRKGCREIRPVGAPAGGGFESPRGGAGSGTASPSVSAGLGWIAVALIALPLGVLMLASPELFKNGLLWASTILVAIGRPMAQGK